MALRRARDCQLPKGERGDSWLFGGRGIVSSPGGVERSDPLALWERVRVRVFRMPIRRIQGGLFRLSLGDFQSPRGEGEGLRSLLP